MKTFKQLKKLLLVFTLTAISAHTYATDVDIELDQMRVLPVQAGLIKITAGGNTRVSGGKLNWASNKSGTFTVSSTMSAYKIKSISFTTNRAPASFSCTDGGSVTGSSTSWSFTPTDNDPVSSAAFSLGSTSSSTNLTMTVKLTTSATHTLEELKTFTAGSSAGDAYTFVSSAATTQVVAKNKANAAASSNYISLSKSSGERSITVESKSGYKLKFIAFYFYESGSVPQTSSVSTGTYTKANFTWEADPEEDPTTSVDLLFDCNSSGHKIWKIYVGYETSGGDKDYTVTAATSTGTNTYGTVSASASSLDQGETTTITATPATGYQVTNWAVSDGDNGASISPNGASNSNTTELTMGTANATVTATFGPKSYTVTLNNQSATSAGTENVTTTYNSNTNLTSAITKPTKTGYVFAGYFTATNGGGVQLIDPAGNWIASAGGGSTYLDGSKNWKYDNGLDLYACWMEYAKSLDLQNYVETEVGSSAGDKKTSKDFTHLTSNNYICSLSGNTELDNSSDAAYRGLKFKNSGDYILFLVPANYSLSVKWGYVKSSKPKYSINGGSAQTFTTLSTSADNTSSPGDIEISSQSYIQLVKLMTSDGNATVLKKVTITSGGCSATANAGEDKATTYNTGVAMAATAATSGYTGAWSIKASSPSTSTSQLSSTSAYNATFTPNAVGTYTLIWTVTDNSDGSCSASDEADVVVSKANISPLLSYSSTTLTVGDNSSSPTVSGNPGSGNVSYAVTSASPSGCITVDPSTGVVTAVAAGSGTVTATVAATTNYNGNTCTANFTVNAVAVTYTVTYDGSDAASGDVPTDSNSPYTSGSTVTVLGNTGSMTRTISSKEATFYGWNTNSDMNSGTNYAAAATFNISSNVTLYARWGYGVSYELGSGSWAGDAPQAYYIYNIAYALPASSAVTAPAGKEFDHWEISDATATSIAAGTVGAQTVTAVYSDITYAITYAAGTYGSGSLAGGSKTYGIAYTLSSSDDAFTRAGFIYDGWSVNADGSTKDYELGGSYTTNAAQCFYPHWVADCPASGSGRTVYKFEVKSDVSSGNICTTQNVPVSLSSPTQLTTLTGGTLQGLVTSSSMNNLAFNSGRIQYANGSAGVLILTLDCAVKTGDIIRFVNYSSSNSKYNYLRHTSNSTTTNQITLNASTTAGTVQEIVVPSAFNNKEELYIVAGSNTTGISYFEIIRPYVVTLNANTNGGKVGGENTATIYAGQSDPQVLPHAFKSDNYFNGWFPNASTGDAVANPYTATESTTLYAQFGDCPDEGTVYKFQVATGLTNGNSGVTGTFDINKGNYLSSLIGGTLTGYDSNGSKMSIVNKSAFKINDKSNAYLQIDLDCAIQTGDIIKSTITGTGNYYIATTSGGSSVQALAAGSEQEVTVPATLVGVKQLFLKITSNNDNSLSYFEIVRPERFAVTYHKNDGSATTQVNTVSTVEDNMFTRNGYTFVKWNTQADGNGTDKAVGAAVTAAIDLHAQWECTTPTFDTDLSTTPHVVRKGDDAVTLTVAASANSGTVTYQWYSNTSKSTAGATTLTTGATYNAPTSSLGTLYYYCVATNTTGGGCTAQSAYATVTVNETPCFEASDLKKAASGWSDLASGATLDASTVVGTITSGTITNSGTDAISANNSGGNGLVIEGSKEITVTLSGSHVLGSSSVITLTCAGNNTTSSHTSGFAISGLAMDPATEGPSTTSCNTFTQTFEVSGTVLEGSKSFKIALADGTTKTYLRSITVTGCEECDAITPSLDYSKKSFWMDDATLTATPTLTGNTGSGAVTYSSSNTDAVTVVESGEGAGTITAVGRGTATITASIAKNAGYCNAEATCEITVKDIGCGNNTIAKATRSGTSASYSGVAGGSALVSNLDGSSYKLTSGGYVGVQLPSTLSFQEGDIVRIDLTIGDWWNGASAGELPAVVYADNTGTNEIYRTDNYTKLTAQVVEFEVTSSMLTALASKQVTVYRKSSTETQNHVVNSVEVKRYTCPDSKEFLPTASSGNWNATDNWIGSDGRGASLPTIDDRVVISEPVTVNIADAKAKDVLVNQYSGATGKITVSAGKALIIAEKMQKTTDGSSRIATAAEDVIINSTRTEGVGALIIGGETGANQATVNFATKAKNDGGWVNQFIGSPFSDNKPYVDYALQLYKFVPRANGDRGWWSTVHEGDEMEEFWGYNVLYNDASELDVTWTGTLNASTSKTISGLYYNGSSETDNMFANSWTAPIHVGAIEDADLPNASKTLYMFNAGTPAQEEGQNGLNAANNNTSPGTYISIPIHSATYAGIGVIPSMQAFYVEAQAAGASITLDYNKVVYTPALTSVGIVPNRAPKRRAKLVEEPEVIKLHVQSETGWGANTYVLSREDFSVGYEDGWDGAYIEGESQTPKLYTPSVDGNMFINCLPQIEGTVVGFRKGSVDDTYTFSFEYDGEEEYYLNDLKTETSTLIREGNTYNFTYEDGDAVNRFMISATPFIKTTPTGVDKVQGDKVQSDKVRKVLIDDHLYIIRAGKVFDATGAIVK